MAGGKYRLEERLGEGSRGVVHRAVHLGLQKSFAIKLLKTGSALTPAALARFRKEALALGRLQHPHIVQVTDAGGDGPDGIPYLVMELLAGKPLSDLCCRGPLPLTQALPLLGQIASAVDAAHGAGVLHLDLKPSNVLVLTELPGPPRIKVLDFGLAELLTGSHESEASAPAHAGEVPPDASETGALRGTPLYMAPELIHHGRASPASDIYSFGVLAYEILGGRPPFQGTVAQVLTGHLEEKPSPLALPPGVWHVLREALQKDPALRPPNASEIVRRLCEEALKAEQTRWESTEIPRRVRVAVLLAAALAALWLVLPWPTLPAIERRLDDLRVRTAPLRPPDPRILLITLDEPSLDSSPLSLADRADEIGLALSRILEAGAQGVAIDLLLPAKWSTSPAFSDLLLRHSGDVTLAAFSAPDGSLVGTECMDRLTVAALGPHRSAELFGFVNLDEDRDGKIRRGRLWFRDRSGNRRPSWAARAARGLGAELAGKHGITQGFWIDTRIDWSRYGRISWRQVSVALDRNPGLFRDRLVLVGGDFRGSGDDYHRIPHHSGTSTAVSGLTLQALLVDTLAAGRPVREPGKIPIVIATLLAATLAAAGLLRARRTGTTLGSVAAGASAYVTLSFPVFWWTGLKLPVTSPLLVLLLAVLTALALRKILPSPPEVPES